MPQRDVRWFLALAPEEVERARRLLKMAAQGQADAEHGPVRPHAYKLLRLLTSHVQRPASLPVTVDGKGGGHDVVADAGCEGRWQTGTP